MDTNRPRYVKTSVSVGRNRRIVQLVRQKNIRRGGKDVRDGYWWLPGQMPKGGGRKRTIARGNNSWTGARRASSKMHEARVARGGPPRRACGWMRSFLPIIPTTTDHHAYWRSAVHDRKTEPVNGAHNHPHPHSRGVANGGGPGGPGTPQSNPTKNY